MAESRSQLVVLISFFCCVLLYSIFSYSLTDPNLVLVHWEPYWKFQQYMWTTFFNNRQLLTATYTVLISALFGLYILLVKILHKAKNKKPKASLRVRKKIIVYALCVSPLLFAHNALSHDVFNYIFNAKMVAVYQANPHQKTAIDFIHIDDWTRFMHNTHTTAPYGYGWTAISLIPYLLGGNKFLPTWLLFKFWAVISVFITYLAMQLLSTKVAGKTLEDWQLALVFFNPLLLLEVLGNVHNDLWMMAPAITSLALLMSVSTQKRSNQLTIVFLSFGLLVISVSVKLATIVLTPIWALLLTSEYLGIQVSETLNKRLKIPQKWVAGIFEKLVRFWYQHVAVVASLLLFIPLMTSRSQQFLPWYLVWLLVWLPWIRWKFWRNTILLFSVTSMYRYLPSLFEGGYTPETRSQEQLITWLIPALYFIWSILRLSVRKSSFLGIKSARITQ